MEESFNNELTRQIMHYFDHQMNPEAEREFLLEIDKNPAGHTVFMKEKHIREKLRANVQRPTRTHALAAQIKEQIKKYPG